MPVSITVRDIPDDVRDELTARAASAGQSLQTYVRTHLVELARRPGPTDVWDRVQRRVLVTGSRLPADDVLRLLGDDRI